MGVAVLAEWVVHVLPEGSAKIVMSHKGYFVQRDAYRSPTSTLMRMVLSPYFSRASLMAGSASTQSMHHDTPCGTNKLINSLSQQFSWKTYFAILLAGEQNIDNFAFGVEGLHELHELLIAFYLVHFKHLENS